MPELAHVLIDRDDDDNNLDSEIVRADQPIPVLVRILMIFLLLWQAFFAGSDAGLAMAIVSFAISFIFLHQWMPAVYC